MPPERFCAVTGQSWTHHGALGCRAARARELSELLWDTSPAEHLMGLRNGWLGSWKASEEIGVWTKTCPLAGSRTWGEWWWPRGPGSLESDTRELSVGNSKNRCSRHFLFSKACSSWRVYFRVILHYKAGLPWLPGFCQVQSTVYELLNSSFSMRSLGNGKAAC